MSPLESVARTDPLQGLTLQPVRLVDQVRGILRRAILEGRLRPGDKLPSESRLCTRLQVSGTAIREALSTLVAEGFIQKRRGATGGSFVANGNAQRILDVVLDCYHLGGLTLEEVIEYRRTVEPMVLELACDRRTEDDLAAMQKNLNACERAIAKGRLDRERQIEFHRLVALATHNRLLIASMSAALTISREFTSGIPITFEDGRKDFESNRYFFDCLQSRRKAWAKKLMKQHFERSRWLQVLSRQDARAIDRPRRRR
jgi:DNA-binding FadR family transcriptional regulator